MAAGKPEEEEEDIISEWERFIQHIFVPHAPLMLLGGSCTVSAGDSGAAEFADRPRTSYL